MLMMMMEMPESTPMMQPIDRLRLVMKRWM
jgi:hypothetical protein